MAEMTPEEQVQRLQELVTTQEPEKADAIVWLQGNRYDRGAKVVGLFEKGFAPTVLVTGNNTRILEDDSVTVNDICRWLEDRGVTSDRIMLDEQSLNTRDQAMRTIETARRNGWKKINLVGSTHHQLRAFLTFLKSAELLGWGGDIINQPVNIDWNERPSGRRKTTREAFYDELEKIERYRGHVSSVAEGLRYFETRRSTEGLEFRPATQADAQRLFDWRNDPSAYRYFNNPTQVLWEDHVAWLSSVLQSKKHYLFIVTGDGGTPVGQVRFDEEPDAAARFSVTIAREHRGKGYGKRVCYESLRWFLRKHQHTKRIVSSVKLENHASMTVITTAGFREVSRDEESAYFEFTLADT